jgi:hypothetical protein
MSRDHLSTTAPIPSEPQSVPRGAYTIRQFAAAHGISESMFFKMQKQGLAPATMMVGARKLISVESAQAL